jgi:chromosome segregation protein
VSRNQFEHVWQMPPDSDEERLAAEAKKKESQSRISKSLVGLEIALGHIENLVGTARRALRVQQDQRSQQSSKLTDLRASLSSLEGKAAELGQGVQDSEMRAYELRLQLNTITDRVASELSLTVEEVLSEASIQQAEEESLEQLEGKLRKLEARLSQLGSFNPLALEEFAALEERHKYLSDQLADLTAARADLASIIADLSEKMQTTFAAAFEDTKKSFEQVFPVLFPGGVEVSVRPAGKRIERMSLLSGGERSLAAIALLIAIFKARPSPFYVLDEVEAALDDANLGRLLEVLETLRETSQLIIVTHQKRTMEIADALYGVSMGKDGITRVVGQKLDKAS